MSDKEFVLSFYPDARVRQYFTAPGFFISLGSCKNQVWINTPTKEHGRGCKTPALAWARAVQNIHNFILEKLEI